jgi:hypothetical protein
MYIYAKDIEKDVEILEGKIFIFKDAISNTSLIHEELDSIDENYEDETSPRQIGPWIEWKSNDDDTVYGKQKVGLFTFSKEVSKMSFGDKMAKDLCDTVLKCATGLSEAYFKTLNIEEVPHLPERFEIKVYDTGTDMGAHYDRHPFPNNETILSAVIYLNDDYEGGELHFHNQDITIKPEAGTVIFFPSTEDFTHSSKKIESGKKHAIPLFFYKNPENPQNN